MYASDLFDATVRLEQRRFVPHWPVCKKKPANKYNIYYLYITYITK